MAEREASWHLSLTVKPVRGRYGPVGCQKPVYGSLPLRECFSLHMDRTPQHTQRSQPCLSVDDHIGGVLLRISGAHASLVFGSLRHFSLGPVEETAHNISGAGGRTQNDNLINISQQFYFPCGTTFLQPLSSWHSAAKMYAAVSERGRLSQ